MPSESSAGAGSRLHPASLLFSIGSAAWKLLLPGLLVLFVSRGRNAEIWLMALFVPTGLAALVKYLSFRYRLDPDELVIRHGVLTRNERHIPYARIQNIDLVQNPLHRLLRVAEIKLETAAGEEPEASIQVLSLAAVERLRSRVFEGRRVEPAGEEGPFEPGTSDRAQPRPREPQVVLRLSMRDLALYGIISNRGLTVVLALWWLAWQSRWQGWTPEWAEQWFDISTEELRETAEQTGFAWAPSVSTALLVVAGLLAFLVVLRLISIGWAFVKLYDFTLTRAGDDLRTSYGLFTRRSATIPVQRIQLLRLRRSPLHRLFDRAEVKVETAGGSGGSEDSEVSRQLLAPLLRAEDRAGVIKQIQNEIDLESLEWQHVDPRAWRRVLTRVLVSVLLAAGLATAVFGARAWLVALPIVPLALLVAWLRFHRMSYALAGTFVVYRSGWWVRHLSLARFAKIQAVDLTQNPFDRRYDMATVRVDTAGAGHTGHRIRIPYLRSDVAFGVYHRLCAEAARREFRW